VQSLAQIHTFTDSLLATLGPIHNPIHKVGGSVAHEMSLEISKLREDGAIETLHAKYFTHSDCKTNSPGDLSHRDIEAPLHILTVENPPFVFFDQKKDEKYLAWLKGIVIISMAQRYC
jgi:hypothetical protein